MNKQEKAFILIQIKRLQKRKDSLIDEFIGSCNEINKEISNYRKMLKEADKNDKSK